MSCFDPYRLIRVFLGVAYIVITLSICAISVIEAHAASSQTTTTVIVLTMLTILYVLVAIFLCRFLVGLTLRSIVLVVNLAASCSWDFVATYPIPDLTHSPTKIFPTCYADLFGYKGKFYGDTYIEIEDSLVMSEITKSFGSESTMRVTMGDVVKKCQGYQGVIDEAVVANTVTRIIERISVCHKSCSVHLPPPSQRMVQMPWT